MKRKVKFGVISDLHVQMSAVAEQHLDDFLAACEKENVDFIIQLGDFCYPAGRRPICKDYSANESVLKKFNGFFVPAFHVIGNHDCDAVSKEELLAFWQSKNGPYYSFDMGGFHFVVLDCNYIKLGEEYISFNAANYHPYIDNLPYLSEEQLAWLEKDLVKTSYPSVLFSHQRLAAAVDPGRREVIRNTEALQAIVNRAPRGVLLAVNGHEHIDLAEKIGNTWYYGLNSASMYWLGEEVACKERYPTEVDERLPFVKYTAPYSNGIYAIITLDQEGASVKGVQGDFVAPSPEELDFFGVYPSEKRILAYGNITASQNDRYMKF